MTPSKIGPAVQLEVSKPHRSRRLAVIGVLGGLLTATGCATRPSATTPARTPAQVQALRSLKFTEGDDGWELDLAARVSFAVDDATLRSDDIATLTRVARVLLGVGIDRITVEGHTDSQGSEEHNLRLSQRRADVVAEQLVSAGFAAEKITRRGHGATRPIAPNTTDAGRRSNRRAVLIVPSA